MKASDNKIDLYRFRSRNDLKLDNFRKRSEILTEPDNMNPQEAIFISGAYTGGVKRNMKVHCLNMILIVCIVLR